ncbi:probable F-box protein At4g22030 [Malania oleifera]|uniref:probable F-box protein At4g22030 n=1 Tax=Malania oleifera TaxID=397392 RepID=UPI0025AE377E|nr:probable F-box protein At4g22030 [Malania oleifera]
MAATLQVSSSILYNICQRETTRASIHIPRIRLPKLPQRVLKEEVMKQLLPSSAYGQNNYRSTATATPSTTTTTYIDKNPDSLINSTFLSNSINGHDHDDQANNHDSNSVAAVKQLYAIMEGVADRIEMHKNVGEQRDNWNHLLLTSINGMTLTAATMAGIAIAASGGGAALGSLTALKFTSTLMFAAATGLMVVVNKIQPSQLAEEQRNAARLFKILHSEIQSTVSLLLRGGPMASDAAEEAIEKVMALDKAYPLPLLGAMLEKFPATVEPAVWWPRRREPLRRRTGGLYEKVNGNGWNEELEEEMKVVLRVLKRKDSEAYLRLSKTTLKVNKVLAISGPLLTSIAAVGSVYAGSASGLGLWAAAVGVVAGALASVVNTLEHGGQVGMVFEMYRSNAGFFRLMEECIELNVEEGDVERRENGEVFEVKVAMQLGRSLSEIRQLAASAATSSSENEEAIEESASKLF